MVASIVGTQGIVEQHELSVHDTNLVRPSVAMVNKIHSMDTNAIKLRLIQ